jgi:hypothetical protein
MPPPRNPAPPRVHPPGGELEDIRAARRKDVRNLLRACSWIGYVTFVLVTVALIVVAFMEGIHP